MPASVLGFPLNIPRHPTLLLSFPFCLPFCNSFISYPLFFHFSVTYVDEDCVGDYIRMDLTWHLCINKLISLGTSFLLCLHNYFCNKCPFHFLNFPFSPGDLVYKRYFSSCTLI